LGCVNGEENREKDGYQSNHSGDLIARIISSGLEHVAPDKWPGAWQLPDGPRVEVHPPQGNKLEVLKNANRSDQRCIRQNETQKFKNGLVDFLKLPL